MSSDLGTSADLRLPIPLLEPKKWPAGEEVLTSIFSLLTGGPLYRRMKSARSLILEAPENIWNLHTVAPILRSRLESDFPEAVVRFNSQTRIDLQLLDWAEAIFVQTREQLDEITFRRLIENFKNELTPEFASFESFRLFPGYLRSPKLKAESVAPIAALDLARVTALFSPQSSEPGEGDLIIANPTLEIIEAKEAGEPVLVAIARATADEEDKLVERTLNWQEALIFDELRENPKLHREILLQELNSKNTGLKREASFEEVVSLLLTESFLLRRGT